MIDFHSHILPGIDDGSRSVEESAEMLRTLYRQGVELVALTSHFYANENSPHHFLERRARAFERLAPVLGEDMPRVRLGAEVYYFRHISHMEGLERLCLEGTNVLLLEMPFNTWTEGEIREVEDLCRSGRFTVMLAHIERYWKNQKRSVWQRLRQAGAVFQCNASFFKPGLHQGGAIRLLRQGFVHVVGTDCHNMSSRKPNMDVAAAALEKRLGQQEAVAFFRRAYDYWEEWTA